MWRWLILVALALTGSGCALYDELFDDGPRYPAPAGTCNAPLLPAPQSAEPPR